VLDPRPPGIARDSVDRFACHPGGAKVITALEHALHLEQGVLDHERTVLSQYGNMSAPTVMFVLERLIAGGLPRRTVMTALGPGFSCGVLSWRERHDAGACRSGVRHAATPWRTDHCPTQHGALLGQVPSRWRRATIRCWWDCTPRG